MRASGHSGHGTRVCQYEQEHGRCRCPDSGTTRIDVQCDQPIEHGRGIHATTEEK